MAGASGLRLKFIKMVLPKTEAVKKKSKMNMMKAVLFQLATS